MKEGVSIPNNEDGMSVLPEGNIVSDEEEFVETDDDEHDDEDHVSEVTIEERLVAVAPLDDVEVETGGNRRPRRSNAGAGVKRIKMDYTGKGYGAKRQFNFVTNGKYIPILTREMILS